MRLKVACNISDLIKKLKLKNVIFKCTYIIIVLMVVWKIAIYSQLQLQIDVKTCIA